MNRVPKYYSLAHFEDHLLQEIGELLDDGHRLAGGEAHSVHGRRGIVARLAEARRRLALALLRRRGVLQRTTC